MTARGGALRSAGLRAPPQRIATFLMCYGPEFVAKAVQTWIAAVGAKTAYIERGSPWENGFVESFNARLRDELSLETEPWWRRIPVIDAELGYALATRDLGEIEEARAAFARAGIDLLLLLIDHPSAVRARRLAFIERVLTTVPDWVPDSAPDSP